jgi:hypothetical protein
MLVLQAMSLVLQAMSRLAYDYPVNLNTMLVLQAMSGDGLAYDYPVNLHMMLVLQAMSWGWVSI